MSYSNRDDDAFFESEVQRIAKILYPDAHGGATMHEGRERDGVYVTNDVAVAIEATRSKTLEKAVKDGGKLKELSEHLYKTYKFHAIKAFFVTEEEPTAHQRDAIKKLGAPLQAISFREFRNLVVNTSDYLDCRDGYAFGSARDPETNEFKVRDEYVPLDFLTLAGGDSGLQATAKVTDISHAVRSGRRILLLGDYGTGKSMTLRQVYLEAAKEFRRGKRADFCIHLNVNDHQGQDNPQEALERHARSIGYSNPAELVRAWRGGYAHLLLDGFDEVFVPGWTSGERPLKVIRRKSVELIREFVDQSPKDAGIVIAGRRHFFDEIEEALDSLGLHSDPLVLSATDFTESQVHEYLKNRSWETTLPSWLPRRPLLIGYLASRQVLQDLDGQDIDPGEGWDWLLDAISSREARPKAASMDADSIRQIIERLASIARGTSSGRGPLGFDDMARVFQDLQGYRPDEGAHLILQRLPGLQVDDAQRNTRSFIDDDYVDAARAGDLLAWITNPNPDVVGVLSKWSTSIGETGLAVLDYKCHEQSLSVGIVQGAVKELQRYSGTDYALCDFIRLLFRWDSRPIGTVNIDSVDTASIVTPEGVDVSNVVFSNSLVELLDITGCSARQIPVFTDCSIGLLDGASTAEGIENLVNSDVSRFGDLTSTMAGIQQLDIGADAKIALGILKKIYAQSGNARKEEALSRGLPDSDRARVSGVLTSLVSFGIVDKRKRGGRILYAPVRAESARALSLLAAPSLHEEDPVLQL